MGKILRCTGLTLLVLGCIALIPATAQAQTLLHGAGAQKSCQPVDCWDNSQCADNTQFCDGVPICPTEGPAPNIDCTIRVTNNDDFGDTLDILSLCDVVTLGGTADCTSAISLVTDVAPAGDTTCTVGLVLGDVADGTSCVLGPGDSIEFVDTSYTLSLADTFPVPDQATSVWSDNCDAPGTQACNGNNNNAQASAQTELNNNCEPGTPPDCTDTLACTINERCDETANGGAGGCVSDPVVCTDDGDACTAPLVCVEPTGCVPSGDDVTCPDLFCNPEACDPADGICKPTGNVPDCGDDNACTTDTCNEETKACDHVDNVTPTCVPDCEICDTTSGACVPNPEAPPTCEAEEICRTPGFWGTHGGTEKEGHSTNITFAVLGAYCGTLEICGQPVTNTDECSTQSALEAICVSPKGNSCLQLGRQLTAAALNCAITKSTDSETGACGFPDCGVTPEGVGAACEGLSIGPIFAACNSACGEEPCKLTADVDLDNDPETPDVTVNCIGAIDCFNNGFTINTETGECDDTLPTGCHERQLCGDFQPPGAAGSPGECADSRKNCVTIFGATDQCEDSCTP